MSEYLNKEAKIYARLKKSGLTENQIEAILEWVEFKLDGLSGHFTDIVLHDESSRLTQVIIDHGHLDGKVIVPLERKK